MRTLSKPGAGILAVLAVSVSFVHAPAAQAAPPVRFSGELSGLVTDAMGKPQPGAVVLLFNRQARLLQKSATAADGSFSFADLLPDLYSIQVTVANFIPAAKESIQVKPGMRSLLAVNLSRIFSTVQLVSTVPAPGGLMSDSWKWVLRSDNAARPVLRLLPSLQGASGSAASTRSTIFSDSRGLIQLSASDGAEVASDGQADLGTQFAFATSVRGGNRVLLAGDVGYGLTGTPSAAIRTTFSRPMGSVMGSSVNPSVSVTMRQIFVPTRALQTFAGSVAGDGTPAMRSMAVSFGDKIRLSDPVSLEYGFELDTVSFFDHLHYFSPYTKMAYALDRGALDFVWTSGNARPELGMSPGDANADLQRDLTALSVLPRVSLLDGRTRVQRGDDYEVGLTQRFGSREYRVEGYEQYISNTALMVASPAAGLFGGNLMPDLFSNSALFNLGTVQSFGYTASATQDLGSYRLAVAYGSTGVLEAQPGAGAIIESADDLRRALSAGHRQSLTLRGSGVVRGTGTRFIASYQFTDYRSAMPAPQLTSTTNRSEPGLNVVVRQPLPFMLGAGWRVEATAELRNLLAQGYLPLMGPGGERVLLVNTPRSVRGGLAFVF